jgi:hypothetical protein
LQGLKAFATIRTPDDGAEFSEYLATNCALVSHDPIKRFPFLNCENAASRGIVHRIRAPPKDSGRVLSAESCPYVRRRKDGNKDQRAGMCAEAGQIEHGVEKVIAADEL